MAKFKEFLQESPDRISDQSFHMSRDAFPFGYYHGKFYFDKNMNGKKHIDLLQKFLDKGDQNIIKVVQKEGYLDSTDMSFNGRFWTNSKVISFWDYPDKSNFNKVVSELKKAGVSINSSWKVEVYDNQKDALHDENSRLIPINDYGNESKGFKSNQLDHVMSPSVKGQVMKAKGVTPGSVIKDKKLPSNMTRAEFNHLTKSESLELNEDAPTSLAPSSPDAGQHSEKVGSVAKRKMPKMTDKEKLKKKIKDKLVEDMNHTDKVLKSLMKKAELEGLKYLGGLMWKDKDGKHFTWNESQKKFTGCR